MKSTAHEQSARKAKKRLRSPVRAIFAQSMASNTASRNLRRYILLATILASIFLKMFAEKALQFFSHGTLAPSDITVVLVSSVLGFLALFYVWDRTK